MVKGWFCWEGAGHGEGMVLLGGGRTISGLC